MRAATLLLTLSLLSAADRSIIYQQEQEPESIFAVGDVHGDAERLSRLLSAAHLAKGSSWTGGVAMLVVTGDMVDKGPDSVGVLRLLSALRASAPAQGGRVVLLAGNHEAEFLAAPSAKKSADFATSLRKAGYDPAKVADCAGDLGEMLCSLPFAARIGEWFFAHAGNTGGQSIADLDRDIRSGLSKDGFRTEQLIGPQSILESRLGEENRWFASHDERALLESYAAALGSAHIVQGHQHNEVRFGDGTVRAQGEIFQRWGVLFLIDVGMSRDIGDSAGAILRIGHESAVAICPDGIETTLWRKSQKTDAGRAICH